MQYNKDKMRARQVQVVFHFFQLGQGNEEGHLYVNITPCTQQGKPLADEDSFVEDPSELLGKPFHFKVSKRSTLSGTG